MIWGKEDGSRLALKDNPTSDGAQHHFAVHTRRRHKPSENDSTTDEQQHVVEHTRPRRLHPLNNDSTSDEQHVAGNAQREQLLQSRHRGCPFCCNRPRRPLLMRGGSSVPARSCFIGCVALLLFLAIHPAMCFQDGDATIVSLPASYSSELVSEPAEPGTSSATSTAAASCRYSYL